MFSPHAMDQFGKPWIDFLSSSEKQEENYHFTGAQVREISVSSLPENIDLLSVMAVSVKIQIPEPG